MGLLFKALGIGLAIVSAKLICNSNAEENKRKETVCAFDEYISKDTFYDIVQQSRSGIRRVKDLYADGPIVNGKVRSQSGISEWYFSIDFNDYGKLTGKYWLTSDNNDSDIPKIIAERIAQQIKNIQNNSDNHVDNAPLNKAKVEHKVTNTFCPHCGMLIDQQDAIYCMYCGTLLPAPNKQ